MQASQHKIGNASARSYYIWTIGCQMNVADSNYVAAALKKRGYAESEEIEAADVVVLNSCVVRQQAEDRIVGKLGELARIKKSRPGTFVALTGCMVTDDQTTLRRRFPMVDLFFKPSAVSDFLVGLPDNAAPDLQEYGVALALEGLLPTAQAGGIASYIPIIYGCNKTCTYCIVPFRRGIERSRTIADIAKEVEYLTTKGVREVTLLGQNVDTYGHDLPEPTDLAALLTRLNDIEDLWRIRFLTSHPKDMAQNLIDAVANLPKAMEHINLPVQAGDDEIIKRMKRRYTLRYYRDGIANRWTHHVSETPKLTTIEALDRLSLRVGCEVPCPLFDRVTAADLVILPAHLWQSVKQPNLYRGPLIGTGPYRVAELAAGRFLRLEANADYFGGAPRVGSLIVSFIRNAATAFAALRAGEVDLVAAPVPPELVEPLSRRDPALRGDRGGGLG